MTGDRPLRLLVLAVEHVEEFRTRFTRNAGLLRALDGRFDLVGTVRPRLSRTQDVVNKLTHLRPGLRAWRGVAGLNPRRFELRTAVAETELGSWEGRYDAILELQTLLAPGLRFRERPYVVYTDNTYALTERHYPAWAPLGPGLGAAWKTLEADTCRHARVVFAMSDFLRRSLLDDYGCEPERVVRVGGGANSLVPTLDGKAYDARVALFVGDAFERKGGATLLRAWGDVRRRVPEATLVIVGPTPPRRGETPGVRWLGHVADRAELARLYLSASVFVLPTLFEPWGHVLLEAMGHGVPCVASAAFAIPEILEDGETGLLVPLEDANTLADALVALLADPGRAEAMGRRAHAEVLAGRTWEHVAERMAPLIEQAAG